ncbi:MAG: EutN/CcmL family microcompartment protein [Eubacteriales bacterium]|nr:EutN/CcmL family microcompartment protein [Eubacteriales bacterium]
MRLARVVGNVVSTVKEKTHFHYKLLIVDYLDGEGKPVETQQIVFDGADAGIGDLVLVNVDGGAAKMLLGDKEIIADNTACGVIDHWTFDGKVTGK